MDIQRVADEYRSNLDRLNRALEAPIRELNIWWPAMDKLNLIFATATDILKSSEPTNLDKIFEKNGLKAEDVLEYTKQSELLTQALDRHIRAVQQYESVLKSHKKALGMIANALKTGHGATETFES